MQAGSEGGRRRAAAVCALVSWLLVGVGCSAFRAANAPLEAWEPDYGYRPGRFAAAVPIGDVLLVLAFSGGGTRAAALAYGVLRELRDTPLRQGGRGERLLDEVDMITSVSGGSFTAAYYGLHGEGIFGDFEDRFLRRNVQRRLLLELLRPRNWFRLAGTFFDRTELAIELYDREIFERATFADLLAAGGPMLQINAADLSVGNRFTFFQPQFDLICSDLSRFQVARAVAASSAVPVLFSPIVLRNYAGRCGFERPVWLDEALRQRKQSPRRYRAARIVESYLDGKRRYIHLVDGGIADNLGLRGPLDNVILLGGLWRRLELLDARPAHVVVLVVNAEVHPDRGFDVLASAPGLRQVMNAVTGVQIYSYNFETLELMRESLRRWSQEAPPGPHGEPLRTWVVEVSFDALEDPEERAYFNRLPTSFSLEDEAVDRLIEAGGRLLRESQEYRDLMKILGAGAVLRPE